ncbi:MAG: heme ABC transporter permease [Minwuia sp.]|nr:heme ABC transporter permease [Minwuia sp.]
MHRFANPTRFLRLAAAVLPFSAAVAALCLGAGLVWGLFFAPPDYQQGDTVRIMFIHVPSAMMAMGVYAGMAISSAIALIWRHAIADLIAKASAPIGATFTFICLLTGSLWGKPMWGTWWVWDARLTSMLIMLFIYLGYMALWQAFDDQTKAARAAAILALVGAINLPVIKFSVEWWNTLHQPASLITMEGPKIHESLLWPLLLMIVGFGAYYLTVLIFRVRAEIHQRRTRMLRMAQADRHNAMQAAD